MRPTRIIEDETHFYKDGKIPEQKENIFVYNETEHGYGTFHSTEERYAPESPSGMN